MLQAVSAVEVTPSIRSPHVGFSFYWHEIKTVTGSRIFSEVTEGTVLNLSLLSYRYHGNQSQRISLSP